MTVDLATLSIKIDSTEAGRAAGELDRLTQSGTKAEQSTDRMGREFVKASSAAGKLRMEESSVRMETERLAREQLKAARSAEVLGQQSQRTSVQMATVTRNAGAQRAGMQQLSYQLGDVSTMFALGARPMQIFASQGAQVVQAIQLMAGTSRGFIGLLAGPWGIAITSAVTVLGTLGMAYMNAADDAEEAVSNLDRALQRFRRGLAETSDLSTAMTKATKERVGLLAQLAAEERRLASAEAARSIPGAAAQGVEAANQQAAAARERIRSIEGEIRAIDNRMESAIEEANLRSRLDREAAARADSRETSEGRTARATAASTARTREDTEAIDEKRAAVAALAAEQAKQQKIEQYETNYKNKITEEAEEMRRVEEAAERERMRAQEELRRQQETDFRQLAGLYEELFTGGIDSVWDVFKKLGIAAISEVAAQWTLSLLAGNAQGSPAGNPLAAIFGDIVGAPAAANDNGGILGVASSASSVMGGGSFGGGLVGNPVTSALAAVPGLGQAIAAVVLTQAIGKGIEDLTGLQFSQTGGLFGGLVGGFVLGALKSRKGGVTIDGQEILSTFGKEKYQQNGLSAADSIFGTLSQIAEALGGELTDAGRVSIGERKGNIRVDPLGLGNTKTGKGAIDFGDDLEAAIAFAIQDLLTDGVLTGISQASQNLLKSGGDIEKQIEKALLIESVPKLLKQRLDPLGAALDEIDEQFQNLADALREGGATAQQFADAERLYNLEREAAAEQFGQSATQLQEYLDSLAFGSNSPLSVRSQLASARDSFSQFEQAILAGETVDVNAFTSSAQTLLGLSRQANASSSGFFADFDRIRDLTQMAIENVDSGALQDGSVVFAQQTAANTRAQAQMQEDTNALLRDIRDRLPGTNDNTSGAVSWLAEQRGF